jgi:hypothetical protein
MTIIIDHLGNRRIPRGKRSKEVAKKVEENTPSLINKTIVRVKERDNGPYYPPTLLLDTGEIVDCSFHCRRDGDNSGQCDCKRTTCFPLERYEYSLLSSGYRNNWRRKFT